MTSLEKAVEISKRFWTHFEPTIKSGNQLYFCFNRDLVRMLLKDLFVGDPSEEFFVLMESFCKLLGDQCWYDELIFNKHFESKSLVILAIAQHVLVVEDMVFEGKLTEDAYFPRLRRRISSNLDEKSAIPFQAEHFLRIWNTFKGEVIDCGASETAITFFAGLASNKYRSYPLSQGLLSTNDLIGIKTAFPGDMNVSRLSDIAIFELVKKVRFEVSARGRRLLQVGWLRQRIMAQVRAFLNSRVDIYQKEIQKHREIADLELRVFKGDLFEPDNYNVTAFKDLEPI